MDQEAQELIKRLEDFENRLISDRMVEECIYKSIKTLENILGKKFFGEATKKFKEVHNVRRLAGVVKKAIRKTSVSITRNNAFASSSKLQLGIYKNSIISDFLADRKSPPKNIEYKRNLMELYNFFSEVSPRHSRKLVDVFSSAFDEKDEKIKEEKIRQIKDKVREYIQMLGQEEKFLQDNLNQMVYDIKYAWSLHNQILHEVGHWIFGRFHSIELHTYITNYRQSMNEGYSFASQKLVHTYEKDYSFNKQGLLREIRELYKLIIPRKYGYNKRQYGFMRSFILLISILILCDSISRKYRDFRNKKLFVQSYSCPNIMCIYRLVESAINNLRDEELKNIIRTTIQKTGINQLRKYKNHVIENINNTLDRLTKLVNNKEESFKSKLLSILYDNTEEFVNSLDLLRIMGLDNESINYRDRYIKVLENTINDLIKNNIEADITIYKKEKNTIDGILAVIKGEEKILTEIVQELKF